MAGRGGWFDRVFDAVTRRWYFGLPVAAAFVALGVWLIPAALERAAAAETWSRVGRAYFRPGGLILVGVLLAVACLGEVRGWWREAGPGGAPPPQP